MNKITNKDIDFPKCLKNATLYFKGNRSLINNTLVTITGSRGADKEGLLNAKKFAKELIENKVIPVTGFATGIEKAVAECGNVICILPCGLNSCYPKSHFNLYKEVLKNDGLLLSLEEPDASAAKWTFHRRNKLLAEISSGFVVIQAKKTSNTLKTAKLSKKVYTLPGGIDNPLYEGNNLLLKEGATAVTSSLDILEKLGIKAVQKNEDTVYNLTNFQKNILNIIDGETHFEDIIYKLNTTLPEVLECLSTLEVMGLAEETKPCIYRKTRR